VPKYGIISGKKIGLWTAGMGTGGDIKTDNPDDAISIARSMSPGHPVRGS
jgi:hypothetical protein